MRREGHAHGHCGQSAAGVQGRRLRNPVRPNSALATSGKDQTLAGATPKQSVNGLAPWLPTQMRCKDLAQRSTILCGAQRRLTKTGVHPTHTSSLSKTSVSNVKVVAVKPLSWKTGKCQSSLAFARRPEGKFAGPVRSSCGFPGRESLFKVAATKVEVYPQAPKLLPGGLSSHQRGNPPEGQPGV